MSYGYIQQQQYPQQQHQPPYTAQPAVQQTHSQSASTSSSPNQLPALLAELHALGVLAGFRYFEPYLRGREELLLRISNDGQAHHTFAHSNVLSVVDPSTVTDLSARTRRIAKSSPTPRATLSDHPPASPCDRELERDDSKTIFLVAGYARYGKPFVWLRSMDPKVLAKLAHVRSQPSESLTTPSTSTQSSDVPLKLESTNTWPTSTPIYLTDIIQELVQLTLSLGEKENPLAIDHSFLDGLALEESCVLTGALVEFLQGVWMRGGSLADKVWPDLQALITRHTKEFAELHKGRSS